MKRIYCVLALTCLAMFSLPGCNRDQDEQGIVARVNGRPIFLEKLQLKYDFKKLSFAAETAGVVALKKDYGGILTDLIVQELVIQELETLGLSVTDEELAAAEAEIRADYPEGAFEEVLVEEYLDLQYWRQELRNRLAMEKFFNEVLRPGITIGYEEAEAYYKDHIQEFYLPQRVRFQLISGPSREAVQNALDLYRKGESLESLQGRFDRLVIREIRLREDRLTVNWKNAIKGLGVDEASSVISGENGFEALVFSEKISAKVLDPSQAYPLVERVLLDQKLRDSFDSWLEDALAVAVIKISASLPLKLTTDEPVQDEAPAEVDIPSADELESPDGAVPPEGMTESLQEDVPPDVMPESLEGAVPFDEVPESQQEGAPPARAPARPAK